MIVYFCANRWLGNEGFRRCESVTDKIISCIGKLLWNYFLLCIDTGIVIWILIEVWFQVALRDGYHGYPLAASDLAIQGLVCGIFFYLIAIFYIVPIIALLLLAWKWVKGEMVIARW